MMTHHGPNFLLQYAHLTFAPFCLVVLCTVYEHDELELVIKEG